MNTILFVIPTISERSKSLAYLTNLLKSDNVMVLPDPLHQGIWMNAKRAWSVDTSHSHICVLQDDVILADNFRANLQQAVDARPTSIISAFSFRKPLMRKAIEKRHSWYGYYEASGQCLVMPVETAHKFVAWNKAYLSDECITVDDLRLSIWCSLLNAPIWYTVPGLVQHNPHMKSSHGFTGRIDPFFSPTSACEYHSLNGDVSSANKLVFIKCFSSYRLT